MFYDQKIYQLKNYKLLTLDNVLVTNFNKINLRLIKIRAVDDDNIGGQNNNRGAKSTKRNDDIADNP